MRPTRLLVMICFPSPLQCGSRDGHYRVSWAHAPTGGAKPMPRIAAARGAAQGTIHPPARSSSYHSGRVRGDRKYVVQREASPTEVSKGTHSVRPEQTA